jgi:NDP-sugar pyrophosphorylase family protein
MSTSVEMPVAILAGGLATRLRPLTETVPKVLLEVGGRPFLEHQLEMLREQGVKEVVLCVGFLGETIEERFGDGRSYGLRLRYSFDGPTLLGTGGAIRQALPLLGGAFFVMYGDSYLQIDLARVQSAFQQSHKPALMTVFHNRDQWDSSNVCFDSGEIKRYDKQARGPDMRHIDYGLSVFDSAVFKGYPRDVSLDLAEVMKGLADRGELAGYEAERRFYEIGSHAGLRELNELLSSRAGREAKVV